MYEVICFGSLTRDVFIRSDEFNIIEDKGFFTGKGIAFSLGSKIPLKEVEFCSGGGGTNAAATFSNQGFKVAYCGKTGGDLTTKELIKDLRERKISTDFVVSDQRYTTNYSVVISSEEGRSILVFRDASEKLTQEEIPWEKLKKNWIYLAPLSGGLADISDIIAKEACKKGAKIALNPGNNQILKKKERLEKTLEFLDLLILNKEEASKLTGISPEKEQEIIKTLSKKVKGLIVLTKGGAGVVVSDGEYLYKAGILEKEKIVDKTGTGDAFGSGFVAGIMKSKSLEQDSIEYAIQMGSANATSCLGNFGAKNGLLKEEDSIWKFGELEISKSKLY